MMFTRNDPKELDHLYSGIIIESYTINQSAYEYTFVDYYFKTINFRLRLACSGSPEKFKLNLSDFISEERFEKKSKKAKAEEEYEEEAGEDEEEENTAVISNV